MADAESLKSFVIDLGFQVDAGQQRRLQEALANVEKNVTRFSQATHRSTGFLGQFFQFFQKSEGPMRRHTETTDKLTKSFDEFGKSLKGMVAIVAGGALTKALLDLNDQFTKLNYTARDAGTSVANLMAEQFGGARVGLSAERITATLTALRQALITMPNAAKLLADSFRVDIADLVDPITGKIKDTSDLFDRLLPRIGEMVRQGSLSVDYVQSVLSSIAGIQLPPDLMAVLLDPDLMRKRVEGEAAAKGWAARLGVDLNQAAKNAVEVTNRFNDIWYILTVIKGGIEEIFGISVARALERVRDKLLDLSNSAKPAIEAFKTAGFEGLGEYINSQLLAGDWHATGVKIGQGIVDGIVSSFKVGEGANVDQVRQALADMIQGAFDAVTSAIRESPAAKDRIFPGIGPFAPGGALGPPLPSHQQGGIVPRTGPAYLHAGEGVVTADAMSGLARLGPIMEDLWDGFRGWWFGSGAYHPTVVIANADDLAEAFHEQGFRGESGFPGNAGGAGPRGRWAAGAPRAPLPGGTGTGGANAGDIAHLGDPHSPGWEAQNLTTITSPSGKMFRVNKWAAPAFKGFIAALEATGYQIQQNQSGGFNLRNIAGTDKLSQHAFGNAIDINSARNPVGGTASDLPPNIAALAAQYGLNWGGNWRTKKDPMHFEWSGQYGALGTSGEPGAGYKYGAFNVGNLGAYAGGRGRGFGSMAEGIQGLAQTLKEKYLGEGYDTLNKIIERFSPRDTNATDELIARASKFMRVDPNQRLGPGSIHDLVTATILNEWGGRFPAGVNQGIIDKALGAAALGTTNSYRAGDKTVTLNAQSNFNISGTDALSVGGAINSVQSRTNADLIRNLSPIIQ